MRGDSLFYSIGVWWSPKARDTSHSEGRGRSVEHESESHRIP